MKIALAQLNYTVGDLDGNKIKIIESIYEAKKQKAELVVFSEFALSGTPAYDLLNKIPFLTECEEALIEIASHSDDIAVLVGMPLQHSHNVVSAAALIVNRHVIRYVGKHKIMSRSELGFLSPSKGIEYIQIGDHKLAIVLGEDIYSPIEYGKHADYIICMHSNQYARGIIASRYSFFRHFAFRTGKNVVFANYLGGQCEDLFDGSSCVYNSKGDPVAFLPSFQESLCVVDPETAPAVPEPEQDKTINIYRAIKLGLRDYFEKNGFTKACLGLSGGIDSAVVASLAAEVLGPENVHVLMMPSQFSSDHSVEDAKALAENLGIGYDVIPITEAYKVINESMLPVLGGTGFDTTEENIQARLRTVMLMALSNKFGYILLNTGNKSEDAVGYSTLYGDMAGAFSIIGDLYKSEVYDLARYINRHGQIIPESILKKEPSAELRPDQKDSDSLPLYDVLDAILYRFVEEGQTVEEITNAGFDEGEVRHILELIKKSEYKRRQGPPVLKLSMRPFGSEFKLPLVNKFLL